MSSPLGCFCGSYQRVGVHAYGCPAELDGERDNDPIRGTLTEEEFREYLNEFLPDDAEKQA